MNKNNPMEQVSYLSQQEERTIDESVQAAIVWPKEFLPENSDVYVRNEIYINASSETVWDWLINAPLWSDWYINATNVQIINQNKNYLTAGALFSWNVFGHPVQCTVAEYVLRERLAWIVQGEGIVAYHAWLIKKVANGCYVLTEETQQGPAAIFGKEADPNMMYKAHELWLERLKKNAEAGLPPQ